MRWKIEAKLIINFFLKKGMNFEILILLIECSKSIHFFDMYLNIHL